MNGKDDTEMDLTGWPIINTVDFVAAYVFDKNSILPVREAPNSQPRQDIAESLWHAWQQISALFDVSTLVCRSPDDCFVVSDFGGLVIQGLPNLNLGLVFKSLIDLPLCEPLAADMIAPAFDQPEKRTLWRILHTIGRCEIPRTIELDIAGASTTINAGPEGFDIVAGVDELEGLVAAIRTATKQQRPIRYTLRDAAEAGKSTYQIHDFLEAVSGLKRAEAANWTFDAEGWPDSCEPDTMIEELEATVILATALQNTRSTAEVCRFSLYDREKRPVALLARSEVGALALVEGSMPTRRQAVGSNNKDARVKDPS